MKNNFENIPLLTIAIPTYNRANLLNNCLSTLAQEFGDNSEIEIIVSNNASTDNTLAVIEQQRIDNFSQIRYFENSENLGPDRNITRCFREAKGKYVWIFSDDDLILPTYGKQLLQLLRSDELGVIYLKSIWFDAGEVPKPVPVELTHQKYLDGLAFVKEVHYWVTFITGNIINKSVLTDPELTYSFNGTNLTQLGWVLPAIFIGLPNVIVTTPILACKANNTGGYKLFETFGPAFNAVMNRLVAVNAIPTAARAAINENLITNFFPKFIQENSSSFGKESYLKVLFPLYWSNEIFWKKIVYTLELRPILGKIWSPVRVIKQIWALTDKATHTPAASMGFKASGANSYIPKQSLIKNPKYITIGDNFYSLYNLRLEAWDSYAGQQFTPEIIIGDNVNINTDCHIGCINRVVIGNNVLMASRIYISDHSHGEANSSALALPPAQRPLHTKGPVVIEDNVWIGEGVCIMPGVTVGANSIVGANSVVTKDIPANSVAAGIPARILKRLT